MTEIRVQHLQKNYDSRLVVNDVNFTVEQGQFCVLLGPSGCGKSTTLRLIAGLEEPSGGQILMGGRDVTALAAKDRRIAMVFQSYALFPHLSVAENIVFGLKVRGMPRAERDRRLADVAGLTGLKDYLTRKPGQLSGGQRQRVALARAIVGEQPICLMDEPLSNLDAKLRNEMRLEIRALQQRLGITMIYVTHDQIEAMTMADRIILMRDGVIEQDGAPADLYERPATVFAARFIGAPPMNLFPPAARDGSAPIVIGVRAEHLRIVPPGSGTHSGEVSSLEYLGADTVIGLRNDGSDPIAIRVPGRSAVRTGEQVSLSWNIQDEHVFEAATGRRIAIASVGALT